MKKRLILTLVDYDEHQEYACIWRDDKGTLRISSSAKTSLDMEAIIDQVWSGFISHII